MFKKEQEKWIKFSAFTSKTWINCLNCIIPIIKKTYVSTFFYKQIVCKEVHAMVFPVSILSYMQIQLFLLQHIKILRKWYIGKLS